MTTDLDKSQAALNQRKNKILETYEGKIQSLLQEKLDNNIDDETYAFHQEDLRRIFLHEFDKSNQEIDLNTVEIKFKNIILDAYLSQIKRGFGCIEAIQTLKPVISQYNNQIGEQVINITAKQTLATIEKIEKLKLTSDLMEAMELPKEVRDKVLSNIVDREFPVKHSHSEPKKVG